MARPKHPGRLLWGAVPIAVVAAVLAGSVLTRAEGPAPITFVASATSDPTDGEAYAKEAIDNLRGNERFRFTQTVAGAGSKANPASGNVDGEVDLASAASDVPKLRSRVHLTTPGGEPVALESVTIDDVVHVRGPKQAGYQRSDKAARKTQGKKAGRGETVAVIDPVMQLLEPVDTLPAGAFGTPSPVTDGNRTVAVTLPAQAALVLTIDDGTRMIEHIAFTNGGKTATFTLSDFGSTAIDIDVPS